MLTFSVPLALLPAPSSMRQTAPRPRTAAYITRRAPCAIVSPSPRPLPPRDSGAGASDIATTADFLALQARAAERGVPAVVFFHAGHCRACKASHPKFLRLATEYAGRAEFASVKMEDAAGLAVRLGIQQVPTVHVYDGERGKVEDFVCGMSSIGKLRDVVEEVSGEGGQSI